MDKDDTVAGDDQESSKSDSEPVPVPLRPCSISPDIQGLPFSRPTTQLPTLRRHSIALSFSKHVPQYNRFENNIFMRMQAADPLTVQSSQSPLSIDTASRAQSQEGRSGEEPDEEKSMANKEMEIATELISLAFRKMKDSLTK